MSRAPSKRQPLDRTIVTRFEVQVADIYLRKQVMSGSIAKRVVQDTDFRSGDAVCGPDRPFVIENIKVAVQIQAFKPFVLSVAYKDGATANIPCSGLFILYGELDRVEVSATEQLRFSYLAS